MTKLLITEITRMGPAFCVIGLQRENEKIHSIRPVPSSANGWMHFRRAELARSLPELFGCEIQENKKGSGLYAMPSEAQRSICGCETQNLRLEICANELRASLVLPSAEVLRDLPVVDHDWRNFVDAALAPDRGANRLPRLERFLNSNFHYKIMSCPHHFIRLGLTRPFNGLCWLMLDTLFPLPQKEWLEEF
jgi:hypothetical protein